MHSEDRDLSESTRLLPDSPSSGPDEHEGGGGRCDNDDAIPSSPHEQASPSNIAVIFVLLIGVFIGNAEGSLVFANHGTIASEFDALSDSSWIAISHGIAVAAVQPLYGKISDIYGRRAVLITAYSLVILGCALCGISSSFASLLVGRVISGVGGAGIAPLVSIVLTDLLPLREVAAWRSYVNVIATLGRSLGGPLGGYLSDTVGWRWSFLLQCPILSVAIPLCWILLPDSSPTASLDDQVNLPSRLARVDFVGATLMVFATTSLMLALEVGGQKLPWSHPFVLIVLIFGIIFGLAFFIFEKKWAKEPIFPLEVFAYPGVAICFISMMLQIGSQVAVMFSVPPYFQITERSSVAVAGAHMIPAVVGNAIGGLFSGSIIHRTGRYKALMVFGAIFACMGYAMMVVRWNGHTNFWESLYIFPGGYGNGIAHSAIFVALTNNVESSHMAVAASALYFSISVGIVFGMASSNAVMQTLLQHSLRRQLAGRDDKIIDRSLKSIDYVNDLQGSVRQKVLSAYLLGYKGTYTFSTVGAAIALILIILLREQRMT